MLKFKARLGFCMVREAVKDQAHQDWIESISKAEGRLDFVGLEAHCHFHHATWRSATNHSLGTTRELRSACLPGFTTPPSSLLVLQRLRLPGDPGRAVGKQKNLILVLSGHQPAAALKPCESRFAFFAIMASRLAGEGRRIRPKRPVETHEACSVTLFPPHEWISMRAASNHNTQI